MNLFDNLPAGIQIKRWFFILTTLVIVMDLIAAVSLVVVTNSTRLIVNRYQPLVVYSGDIASSIYKVQTGLYQYLAEYQQDTSALQKEIKEFRQTIDKASGFKADPDFVTDLKTISTNLDKYEKVVKLLPKIGMITDWEEVGEFKEKAIELGDSIEKLATEMKAKSYRQVKEKAAQSRNIASLAVYVFIGFLLFSFAIIVLLFIWWKDFQAMILKL